MEELDVRARLLRGRALWFVVGAVVLLVGVGIVRLVGVTPSRPGPAPPAASTPRASRTAWPERGEVGTGTLYALADGEVHRIDVASGRLTSTGVRLDPIDTRLTALGDGVLVWLGSGGGKRLVGPPAVGARPVPGALRRGDAFLAGQDGSVWTASSEATRSDEATTWRLVDQDGHVSAEAEVVGTAASDGAGGLLAVLHDGFRRAYPSPPGPLVAGELLGSGPHGYLSRTCTDDGRCTALLHDPATGEGRGVGLAPPMEATPGAVSPGNRFVTLSVLGEPTGAVQVRSLDSPRVLESFMEDGPPGGSAVWLSDRWVALISGNAGIVLYDAVADETIRPTLALESTVQQLVWSPV